MGRLLEENNMLDTTVSLEVTKLLDQLNNALSSGDVNAATDLFLDDCYWRDLVTFTWNIKTLEGKDEIRNMLNSQLASVKPSDWQIAEGEPATEEGGIITAWISFETAVARGYGLVRLKEGKIWTLLTSMTELKGHEESLGLFC